MTEAGQDKPDLMNGNPGGDLADGAILVGQSSELISRAPSNSVNRPT